MIKKLFAGTLGVGINVVIYILVILVLMRASYMAYDFSYEVFGDTVMTEDVTVASVPVQIQDGESTEEIAAMLKKKGLIANEKAFLVKVALSGYKGSLRAGTYELSPTMTQEEMLAIMSGETGVIN